MPRGVRGRRRMKRGVRRGGANSTGVLGGLRTYQRQLVAERQRLDSQIAAIDQAIQVMGGGAARTLSAVRGSQSGRYRRGSLKEHILRTLSAGGGAMAVRDVTAGVLRSGYRSKNKTLAKSVGIALADMSEVAKVGRGTFQLR